MKTTKAITIEKGADLQPVPTNWGTLSADHVCVPVAFGPHMTGWLIVQVHKDLFDSGYVENG